MSNLHFSGVSLNALAEVSEDGRHLWRVLSFSDGHKKVVGCILGQEGTNFSLTIDSGSSERIEITQGECEVFKDGSETSSYYREGQSFVVASGTALVLTCEEVLQYVRHLEG